MEDDSYLGCEAVEGFGRYATCPRLRMYVPLVRQLLPALHEIQGTGLSVEKSPRAWPDFGFEDFGEVQVQQLL